MDKRADHEGREAAAARNPARAPNWRAALRAEWRRPTTRREALRLVAWVYVAAALVIPLIRIGVGFNSLAFPLTLVAALAALLWVAPRQGEFRTWLFYLVALYFFTQVRDAADETSIRASTGYVLDWEEWMFGGTTPSAWLQDRLGGASGDPGVVAFLASFTHWTWFVFPHAVVVGTYFLARPMFFRVAVIMMGIFFAAVLLYYLVPTVPPWLAVEEGNAAGIVRIMRDVGPTLFGQALWERMFEVASEPNPRAAMPSLHFAAAVQMALIGWLLRSRKLTALALVYSAALGFSLVYLGEHYFVDLLVGGLLAGAAFFLVERALAGPGLGSRWRCRWGARLGAWVRGVRLPARPEPRRGERVQSPPRGEAG